MSQDSKTKTCDCGGSMKKTQVTKTIPLAGRLVRVEDIQSFLCDECGEVYFDGPTLLKLESKLLKQPVLT